MIINAIITALKQVFFVSVWSSVYIYYVLHYILMHKIAMYFYVVI